MLTEIQRKERQIQAIQRRLDNPSRIYCRNYIQTTCRNDGMCDLIAQLVDLENEVKILKGATIQ